MTYATPFWGEKKKAKSNGAESKDEKKDALAKDATQWVVVGIGNLKVNVPKPDVAGPFLPRCSIPRCIDLDLMPCCYPAVKLALVNVLGVLPPPPSQ
jgi:hypothetical protein